MFLAAVDQTLLAAATPAIAQDLGGIQTASWIAIGYLLAGAASVPIHGWLGDRYGRRNILIAALFIFSIGSIVAALAGSMAMLIAGRVIQGIGGGGLMSLSQALIGELVPPRQRARFQGYFSAMFALASVSGPVLGGLVVSYFTWHWLFWANLPIAAFAIYRLCALKQSPVPPKSRTVDWWGLLLFPLTTTAIIYWLSSGGHEFAWQSMTSYQLLIAMVILSAVFIFQQSRTQDSFLPLSLLARKEIYIPLTSSFLFAACMFALVFFLPIYLQLGLGANAAMSGLLLLPLTAGMITGAYITGKTIAKTGVPKWMPVIGMSIATFGFALLGLLEPSKYLTGFFGLICGLGLGTVMPSTQIQIQTVGGKANLGRVTSMASLCRSLGASVGTALFGALTYSLIPDFTSNSTIADLLVGPKEPIIHAFQTGFLVAGGFAFITVINAARAPRIHLDDYD
nr:MDR family MFS transporter [Vibrio rumoiensis]